MNLDFLGDQIGTITIVLATAVFLILAYRQRPVDLIKEFIVDGGETFRVWVWVWMLSLLVAVGISCGYFVFTGTMFSSLGIAIIALVLGIQSLNTELVRGWYPVEALTQVPLPPVKIKEPRPEPIRRSARRKRGLERRTA